MTETLLTLNAETAKDIMKPNPISVRAESSTRDAIDLLIHKGFTAAPVIDASGRAMGVLSRTDLVRFDLKKQRTEAAKPEYYEQAELTTSSGDKLEGFLFENVDRTTVEDIMTPVVYSVRPETPASQVVEQMLTLGVHRLFVVDHAGIIVGVISGLDVLRKLG